MRDLARLAVLLTVSLLASWERGPARAASADDPPKPTPEQARFFEAEVRPVLAEHCYKCHGPDKQKGGLRVDDRALLVVGGESGPAVVPGKPEESLIVEAIRHEGLEMPPKGKLDDRAVEALVKWVEIGAPWPGPGGGSAVAPTRAARGITDADRDWWAFRPVREPAPPVVDDPRWAKNPIDRFLFARLAREGLSPAPEADRGSLIRRVSHDLTGLPPTPEELDTFLQDDAPDAYERLVDRLLASPRYGERMARGWLDLVRYADSDGYRADHDRPTAWHYRDYVVSAFNADKPYDRFVQEQIAGDELFPGDPDALVATGYLRHGIYEYNNRDAFGQWTTILDDITDTTADVFLGMGLQCARCHDHKFDPILQKDYYRLRAFFAAIRPRDDLYAAAPEAVSAYRERLAEWEAKTAELRAEMARLEEKPRTVAVEDAISKFPDEVQAILRKPRAEWGPLEMQVGELAARQIDYEYTRLDSRMKGEVKERWLVLRKQLAVLEKQKPPSPPMPQAISDIGPEAPEVTIPKKGPAAIEPGVPSVLDPAPAAVDPLPDSTGRRATLARWLTASDNPLAARVIVNRIWQHHFGKGLAANASDFGRLGDPPTHPELLDWLAARLVADGWSLKQVHRRIVTSAAYRQSTRHPEPTACLKLDPENRLYWRGNTRRLDAEQIRDTILAVSGQLSTTRGGPGTPSSEPRRSIYTKMMRNVRDPLLEVFDLPLAFGSVSSRDTTTTPLQSLLLINSQAMLRHAGAFASRVAREAGDDDASRVVRAYLLAFNRLPTSDESSDALAFLREQPARVDVVEASAPDASFVQGKIPLRDGKAAVVSLKGPQQKFEVPDDARLNPGEFTVEAFFVLRSVDDGAAVRTLAAKWDGDLANPGWGFGITGKGSRRKPQTLVLQLIGRPRAEGAGAGAGRPVEAALFADHTVQLDRPYYAAVSVRPAADGPGTATFYLKDLSNDDEPLLIARLEHEIAGGVENDRPLTLGGRSGTKGAGFDGMIDDIRLSSSALSEPNLLYTAEAVRPDTMGFWKFETDPGPFRDASKQGLDIRPTRAAAQAVDPRRQALADLCHAMLNANEFLYVD